MRKIEGDQKKSTFFGNVNVNYLLPNKDLEFRAFTFVQGNVYC